jgi:hypothetical protein
MRSIEQAQWGRENVRRCRVTSQRVIGPLTQGQWSRYSPPSLLGWSTTNQLALGTPQPPPHSPKTKKPRRDCEVIRPEGATPLRKISNVSTQLRQPTFRCCQPCSFGDVSKPRKLPLLKPSPTTHSLTALHYNPYRWTRNLTSIPQNYSSRHRERIRLIGTHWM